jgi:hypothetical protein
MIDLYAALKIPKPVSQQPQVNGLFAIQYPVQENGAPDFNVVPRQVKISIRDYSNYGSYAIVPARDVLEGKYRVLEVTNSINNHEVLIKVDQVFSAQVSTRAAASYNLMLLRAHGIRLIAEESAWY